MKSKAFYYPSGLTSITTMPKLYISLMVVKTASLFALRISGETQLHGVASVKDTGGGSSESWMNYKRNKSKYIHL